MNIQNINQYWNKKEVEFIINQRFIINEDNAYVPRFSLKNIEIFKDIPVNKPLKPSKQLIIKAIKYGMIFLINYKGEKDKHFAGHERVIYPMVLGKSSQQKILLRGHHLNGWSVSQNKHVNKVWRMFRYDRILSLTFTGSFYRLPPEGYNVNDKGMRGGIIAKADFNQIRRNQQTLVSKQKIQSKEEVSMEKEGKKFAVIKAKPTDTILDLNNVFDNQYLENVQDIDNLRISFLKSIYGNKYVAMLGAIGKPGNTVKLLNSENNQTVGTYRVLDSVAGSALKQIKRVKGNTEYELYIFEKKV
ncbi:MAG: hypothetical protein SLAVMIC_00431 [uncultured marine phage]|uniref:Uncharacterized protein n=1 Tax=uncultured marine phage TaxID=707152 RepID=A0A8D9CE63_9VIRU|nr:MAG: hypothetical protein SLAVMIC_00431 [uncultured marine phage]